MVRFIQKNNNNNNNKECKECSFNIQSTRELVISHFACKYYIYIYLPILYIYLKATRLLGKGLHTLIKGVSFSSPTNVGFSQSTPFRGPTSSLTLVPFSYRWYVHPPSEPNILISTPPHIYPLWGTASSLAHNPVSGTDTISNGSSPPLADIVFFGLSLSNFPSSRL